MTYVVTENCINCKHTTCVDVCPTEAFHEGPNFLVINPEACIDCNLCPAECPIGAIYSEDELPENMQHFLALNAELAEQWPQIESVKEALPEALRWDGVGEKLSLLVR